MNRMIAVGVVLAVAFAILESYAPLSGISIGHSSEDPAVKNRWNPVKIRADWR